MSFDYSDLATTATELLTEFGQTATLARTVSGGATESSTGVALRRRLNEGDRRRLEGSFGSSSLSSSKYLLGADVTPQLGDRLTVGSDSIVLSVVDPIQPGATTIAWQVLGAAG